MRAIVRSDNDQLVLGERLHDARRDVEGVGDYLRWRQCEPLEEREVLEDRGREDLEEDERFVADCSKSARSADGSELPF